MSHPFGDLLHQHLHRRHGLTQSKLAEGILQDPSVISNMCRGRRLTGEQARSRVVAIVGWLQEQDVLSNQDEATALLNAAGLIGLQTNVPEEAVLLAALLPVQGSRSKPSDRLADHAETLQDPPSNLPQLTRLFVGRETELDTLETLLGRRDVRLVSIIGPGGSGKTRLALKLAREYLAADTQGTIAFPDGIFFADLTSVQSADQLISALAEVLELPLEAESRQQRNPRRQVQDYLRHKQMLMLCDNFEHLLAYAELLVELLHAASHLKILVTTREPLRLQEEHHVRLKGLEYPEEEHAGDLADFPAIHLFHQKAKQLHLQAESIDLAHIGAVCRAVEGMPLALELAAGWTDTLSIAEIVEEIATNLDLLTTELRNVPERHRSMRAVFDSTWQRLGDFDRRLFARLSFFRGGFMREAAEEIAGASLSSLSTLVKKSLLDFDDESSRYFSHELLRQYAEERFDNAELFTQSEADRFEEKFAAYYLAMLSQHLPDLKTSRQQHVLMALDRDLDNISRAWRLAAAKKELHRTYDAMDTLAFFFLRQGRYQEGLPILAQIADLTYGELIASEQKVLARVLTWQGVFSHRLGDVATVERSLQQAETRIDHAHRGGVDVRSERALLFLLKGDIALHVDFDATMSAYTQSLSLYRALDEPWEAARVLAATGRAIIITGDYDRARAMLEESLFIQHSLDDPLSKAETLESLSMLARYHGDVADSERLALEGLQICRELANRAGRARMLSNYGAALMWNSRADLGRDTLKESVRIFRDLGDQLSLAIAEFRLAAAYIHLGEYDQAQVTAQQSYAHAVELEKDEDSADALRVLGEVALVRGQYKQAYSALSEAVTIFTQVGATPTAAKVMATQALAERALRDIPGAKHRAFEALSTGVQRVDYMSTPDSLATVAVLLVDEGDIERAIRVYEIVRQSPARKNHRFLADVVGSVINDAAEALSPADVEAIRTQARSLNLWTEARDLLDELVRRGWGEDR